MTRIEGVGLPKDLPDGKIAKSKADQSGGFGDIYKEAIREESVSSAIPGSTTTNTSAGSALLMDRINELEVKLQRNRQEIENFKNAINAYQRGQAGGKTIK